MFLRHLGETVGMHHVFAVAHSITLIVSLYACLHQWKSNWTHKRNSS